jgi:hypothetical protein
VHDTAPAIEQATGVQQCKVTNSVERPMLAEWPATEKAALHTNAQRGVVVVRYDGCRLKMLEKCKAESGYKFNETPRAKDGFTVKNKSELFTKLPLGAVSLEGTISQGNTLSMTYVAVGTRTAQVDEVTNAELSGSCDGATHYVRSMIVGAYELSSEKAAGGGAGIEVGSAGAGGSHTEQSNLLKSDGDISSCVDRETPATDSGCQAIIQLVLEPISETGSQPESTSPEPPQPTPQEAPPPAPQAAAEPAPKAVEEKVSEPASKSVEPDRLTEISVPGVSDLTTYDYGQKQQDEAKRLNSKAMKFYKAKDYPAAIATFIEALEHNPASHWVRFNLACTYALSGEEDKALDLLQQLRVAADKGCEPCAKKIEHARTDKDFASLRKNERFKRIVEE